MRHVHKHGLVILTLPIALLAFTLHTLRHHTNYHNNIHYIMSAELAPTNTLHVHAVDVIHIQRK